MKISEILQLAIDKEYWLADKNKYGSSSRTFMCIVVEDMVHMGLITREEFLTVRSYIEHILAEYYTLTDYLVCVRELSHFNACNPEARTNFWNQVIKALQAKGE